MKKLVLVTLALGVCIASFAQKNMRSITKVSPRGIVEKSIAEPNQVALNANGPVKIINSNMKGGKSTLNKTVIGTSGNMLTVQMSDIRCLSVWPDLNLVAFTHRSGGSHGPTPVTAANYQRVSFSIDGGSTFRDSLLTSDQTWANRYPSGVVVNRTGNTNAMHASIAFGGPYHLAGAWKGHYLSSQRLDNSISHYNYLPWTVLTGVGTSYPYQVSILNMAGCSDMTAHGLTVYWDETATPNIIFKYAEMLNGSMAASVDTLDWTHVLINPKFAHIPSDPTAVNYLNAGQAWSEDGSIGYAYFFGIDSLVNFNNSCEPIVYKSTDKGATWTKMPIFDFSTISSIGDSIWPLYANQTTYVPGIFGSEQSGTVDANGDLHIVTEVVGQYTNNLDSIGYSYTNEPKKLYDLHTTSTGWDATCFATFKSATVLYTDANALPTTGTGNAMGWDHRLNLSRTVDGTKLFAVWTDVVDTATYPNNALPDVIAYSWDITNGHHTTVKNFTTMTAYDGDNYWMHVGDRVLENGTEFDIPVTTTLTGSYQEDTCQHFYLSGIYFNAADYTTGIIDPVNNISSVSQNYPNPFNGTTSFSVSLVKSADLSVIVTNIVGQKVSEINMGTVTAGSHTINLDATKLTSGIYFYTVKAGEGSVTKKMIVE
jgi:hypothetical protein